MNTPGRQHFLGVDFDQLDVAAAAAAIAARPAAAAFVHVTTPNALHIVLLHRGDARVAAAHRTAWLRLCDSQVLRILARFLFGLRLAHAPGSDLTLEVLRHVLRPGEAVTVIGGNAEMLRRLRAQYGVGDIAFHDPPMGFWRDPAALQAAADFVRAHPARLVFLAVGFPQSEMLAMRVEQLGGATGTGLCIGSSLLFATGMVPRAPRWMRRHGLEWLYRLLREPRRLIGRYARDSLPVVWIALAARVKG